MPTYSIHILNFDRPTVSTFSSGGYEGKFFSVLRQKTWIKAPTQKMFGWFTGSSKKINFSVKRDKQNHERDFWYWIYLSQIEIYFIEQIYGRLIFRCLLCYLENSNSPCTMRNDGFCLCINCAMWQTNAFISHARNGLLLSEKILKEPPRSFSSILGP